MVNWQAPGDPLASLRLSLGGMALPTLPPSLGIWCLCTGLDPAILLTGDPGTTWYPQGWVCVLLASFPFSLYIAFYDFMHLHLINQFSCYLSQALKIKIASEVLKIIIIFIKTNPAITTRFRGYEYSWKLESLIKCATELLYTCERFAYFAHEYCSMSGEC